MKRLLFIFTLLLSSFAAAAAPEVKLEIETKPPIWAGQKVLLSVEISSPTYFTTAAIFDLPRVEGLQLFPPTERPIIRSEVVAGQTLAMQRHELSLIAQRGGNVVIPPFTIRYTISGGIGKPDIDQSVTTQPLALRIQAPPSTQGMSSFLSTTSLKIDQEWTPSSTTQFKVGDSITRKIIIRVADLPAMAIPPLPAQSMENVSVYSQSPEVTDQNRNSHQIGQRIETITYICRSGGTVELPDYSLKWWNVSDKKIHEQVIAGKTIQIAAPATPANQEIPQATEDRTGTAAVIICYVSALAAIAIACWAMTRPKANTFPLRQWQRDLDMALKTQAPFEIWKVVDVRQRIDPQFSAKLASSDAWERVQAMAFSGRALSVTNELTQALRADVAHRSKGRLAEHVALKPLNPNSLNRA